ncbi:RNA-directed DNA polymerase like [Apostasia shenzhenica]|uniref:RNA-directed DNA polymerase like n=1 Tax=Apostasia shenzhenica TaxID=1088818 RepID=A0A2H9ZQN2_9ASPA|nr:RNA-directed DNA polymerase like [Apostasia shenzhenica]
MAPTFTAAEKGKAPEVAEAPAKASPSTGPNQQGHPYPPAARTINVVFSIDPIAQRQATEVGSIFEQHASSIPLTFCSKDLPQQGNPLNDPIVVVARIADFDVRRVLLDFGSAADILFESAFLQMGLKEASLLRDGTTLLSFSGERVQPLGFIALPISFGDDNGYAMSMVNFAVIRAKSGYNTILGRTTLNSFRMVISTPHLCAKFPTSNGVVTIRRDARQATRCFQIAAQLVVDQMDPREIQPVTPQEGVISVALGGEDISKIVNISSYLNDKQQVAVIALLSEYIDVFAWSPEDVTGMDRAVCEHHLNVYQAISFIAQKKRVMAGEMQDAIKEEINKLLGVGYIREVQYPQWLTNVVMVNKANGKWRMRVDFRTLNQACSKDTYPLPRIDAMVDRTVGYEIMSFLDAFSRYHQIWMAKEDEEKTAFITDYDTYCYNVMPFGLKNVGATYQRMIDAVFKGQRGRNLEAYVDDILVKSKSWAEHLSDLRETVDTLRRYNLKLNPAKCTFGVASEKFLGYLVSARGIEANPDKISAILSMPSPKTAKEIQKLAGRINSLGRFISKAGDRCSPFFRCLRNKKMGNGPTRANQPLQS